jgi:hypothetical protein
VGLTSGAVQKCLPVNVVRNILSFPFVLQEQLRKEKEMLRYRLVGKSGGQNLVIMVAGTLEESWSAKWRSF